MRKIELYINDCLQCPYLSFTKDHRDTCNHPEIKHKQNIITIKEGFPQFCPLTKVDINDFINIELLDENLKINI